MKLEQFGFEIYAAIDGYSRFIPWIYIGISARTAVSVLSQYLDCVSTNRFLPKNIRSDLGSETMLLADAHFTLRRSALIPGAIPQQLHDCYFFGRSTEHQRIESWWQQLVTSCTHVYYHYFHKLKNEGINMIFL